MNTDIILFFGGLFVLGGLAGHALTFALDYRRRMREQHIEALRNRIMGSNTARFARMRELGAGMRGREL
jgi:hypothetical protein